MAFKLHQKVALITGGGRGIGAAIATRFAESGASVMIANRTLDAAEELAASLTARGYTAKAALFDDLTRSALTQLVEATARQFGGLDIVVHNAGGCPWKPIAEMDEATLDAVLDLNLKPCFWLTQAAVPHMRKRGKGRILVTSSVSAHVAIDGGAHYSAAKAGVNAFIRGAAFELAREGITVNGVEPGYIAKPGRGLMSAPERKARVEAHIPMGHMGEADDIAYAMLYLASDESKYMTGQTITIDGGSTLPETGYAVESKWGLE